jgi:hypothetical protein
MKTNIIALSLVVVGCGSPEQQAAVVAALSATPTPVAETPVMMSRTMAAPQQTIAAPAQLYSLRVSGKDTLPECTVDNEAQLAYASTEKQFYACQDSAWLAIDITGAAGKNGIDGKDGQSVVGPQGVQGVAGQSVVGERGLQGIQGVAGRDGIDGQSVTGAAGQNGINGQDGLSVGILTTTEAIGSNCTTGGQKVQAFRDDNANGAYDAGEVLLGTASYVCNGARGVAGTGVGLAVSSIRTCALDPRVKAFSTFSGSFVGTGETLDPARILPNPSAVVTYQVTTYTNGMKWYSISGSTISGGVNTVIYSAITSSFLINMGYSYNLQAPAITEVGSLSVKADNTTSLKISLDRAQTGVKTVSGSIMFFTASNTITWDSIPCTTTNY